MEWIQSTAWTPEGVLLSTLNTNKEQTLRPVNELQTVLAITANAPLKTKSTTSFAAWHKLTSDEIAALATELGFQPESTGQGFYAFEADGRRHILPAGILMCALFRPFHGIARYLVAPQGLDNLCRPHGNSEKPEMMFFTHPRTATGMQADKAQGIINSLSWMHCFPSARKMWCSVLEYAKQGQLDIRLPVGNIDFLCSGQPLLSGAVLIRELRIRLLHTDEEPIETFSLHARTIEFERILHKSGTYRRNRNYPKDSSIPLRDGSWTLTDAEWQNTKQAILRKQTPRVECNARRLTNLLLEKLSQGVTWASVAPDRSEQAICRDYHTRLKADGRWKAFIEKLTELRKAT